MKRIYRLSVPVVLMVALAGCHQGMNASTTIQGETGNGSQLEAGDIEIEAVTIVAGERGQVGALSAVVVNSGNTADRLESVLIEGRPAALNPDGIDLPAQKSVNVSSEGEMTAQAPLGDARPGQYVQVTFRFAKSGDAESPVLIVPPVGYYESVAPKAPSQP